VRSAEILLGAVADPSAAAVGVLCALGVERAAVEEAVARIGADAAPAAPETAEERMRAQRRSLEAAIEGRPRLDYETALEILTRWLGREVLVTFWSPMFDFLTRPALGTLEDGGGTGGDEATFTVRPGQGRPGGVTFVVRRAEFVDASWAGAPGSGSGLSLS
jgi:hypothetical protein